ncbi:MAG TPA: DUF5683 domain-containing protein [Fibrobacteria bacterium]|nr:DUF5683 domain-containing protein [Fibrobacteria bacterium]HOX52832.1 DUF5683 domain-containing protein [Fibrobacteria bacterium]
MRLHLLFLYCAFLALPGFATESRADSILPSPSPTTASLQSLVLPGLGQYTTGHPIQGTILVVGDLWLYGDVINRTWKSVPDLRDKASDLTYRSRILADTLQARSDTTPASRDILRSLRDSAYKARSQAKISADYRNSELAWAAGLHLYSVVTAAEDAWLRRGGKRPVTSMAKATVASALVPGLGQIYNQHYSKAALLYLGVLGATVSYNSRQEVVDFFLEERRLSIAEGRGTSDADQQLEFFRKRRNQYIWGLGLVYVYQILDAAVDARLSRVGESFPISATPRFDHPGMTLAWNF